MQRTGGGGKLPRFIKTSSPRAALMIEQAQGHPLTPQQRVALAEAQGQMNVLQARHQLQKDNAAPRFHKTASDGNWLWNLLGVREVADAVSHPGVGTSLEALAALPLPWTKALKGGALMEKLAAHEAPGLVKALTRVDRAEHASAADILRRTPQPVKTGLHHSHTAFNVATAGAATANAAVNPNKNSALTALGYVLPTPPEERVLLHHLATAARTTASANSAVQTGSIGAGLNAFGSSPLREREDAAALEALVSPIHRGIAAHNAAVPAEGEGNAPIAELLSRLMNVHGAGFRTAAGYVYGR